MQISVLAKTSASDQRFQAVNKGSITPCCRYTEDPFDSHPSPVGDSHSKIVGHMLVDEKEKIVEELLSIGTADIRIVVVIIGIQVQFEMLDDVQIWISKITAKPP